MYVKVNFSQFVDSFRAMGRDNQFAAFYDNGKPIGAYDALRVIFDHIEECEESGGDELELDVIAICCDYSHDTAREIADQYSLDIYDGMEEEEIRNTNMEDRIENLVREYLEDQGAYVGETEYGFVYFQH